MGVVQLSSGGAVQVQSHPEGDVGQQVVNGAVISDLPLREAQLLEGGAVGGLGFHQGFKHGLFHFLFLLVFGKRLLPFACLYYSIYVHIYQDGIMHECAHVFLYNMYVYILAPFCYTQHEVMYMPLSESQKRANQKYRAGNIKRVPLDMQVTDYENMKMHTEQTGESVNGFIKRAITETIERDTTTPGGMGEGTPPTT